MLILCALLGGVLASLSTIFFWGLGRYLSYPGKVVIPVLQNHAKMIFFLVIVDLSFAVSLGSITGLATTYLFSASVLDALGTQNRGILYLATGFCAAMGIGKWPLPLLSQLLQDILNSENIPEKADVIHAALEDFSDDERDRVSNSIQLGYRDFQASRVMKHLQKQYHTWRQRIIRRLSQSGEIYMVNIRAGWRSQLIKQWKSLTRKEKLHFIESCCILEGEEFEAIKEKGRKCFEIIELGAINAKMTLDEYVDDYPDLDDLEGESARLFQLAVAQENYKIVAEILRVKLNPT